MKHRVLRRLFLTMSGRCLISWASRLMMISPIKTCVLRWEESQPSSRLMIFSLLNGTLQRSVQPKRRVLMFSSVASKSDLRPMAFCISGRGSGILAKAYLDGLFLFIGETTEKRFGAIQSSSLVWKASTPPRRKRLKSSSINYQNV